MKANYSSAYIYMEAIRAKGLGKGVIGSWKGYIGDSMGSFKGVWGDVRHVLSCCHAHISH